MHIIVVYFPLQVPLIEEVICLSTKLIPVKMKCSFEIFFFRFLWSRPLTFLRRSNERKNRSSLETSKNERQAD